MLCPMVSSAPALQLSVPTQPELVFPVNQCPARTQNTPDKSNTQKTLGAPLWFRCYPPTWVPNGPKLFLNLKRISKDTSNEISIRPGGWRAFLSQDCAPLLNDIL